MTVVNRDLINSFLEMETEICSLVLSLQWNGIAEFAGVENDGLEIGGLGFGGLQDVNLRGTWLRHVAYTKEWLQSKTWVEQQYNIAQHNITALC